MHTRTIVNLVFFLFYCLNNYCIVTGNRKTTGNDVEQPENVSCAKSFSKHIERAPVSGAVEDITDEMVAIHKKFTPESVEECKADDTMRKAARDWCEIQFTVGCDLVYPVNVALNAATVPAFSKIDDVAQLWYNERSNFNSRKSILDNVKDGYDKGYEVIHYANMVANYPGRTLGCCRAPCKDGICFAYACAYGNSGAGFWRIAYNESSSSEDETENVIAKTAKGFEFYSPIGSEIVASPRTELVQRIPNDEFTSVGCSANVAGNGPTATTYPWKYPCRMANISEGIIKGVIPDQVLAAGETEVQKTWRSESEALFNSLPVLNTGCNQLAMTRDPPILLYCPSSCLSTAITKHYETVENSNPLDELSLMEEEENGKRDFSIMDVGESICGQATSHKALASTVGLVRVLVGGTFEEHGIYVTQSCSATRYSFSSCGSDHRECFAQIRIPSKTNPWIMSSVQTAAADDVGELIFILRNSLCKRGEFSIKIRPTLLKGHLHELSVLAHYINPSNFIALRVEVLDGVASLTECNNGICERRSRYFVGTINAGSVIDLRLNSYLVDDKPSGRITATVNGESVGVIEKTRGPPVGFFGFAIGHQSHLHEILGVSLIPSMDSTIVERNINKQDSLIPHWRVEGSKENDVPFVS